MLQNIVSMKNSFILLLIKYRDTRFCHEKEAQNVVTGWVFTKKGQNFKTPITVNSDVTKYNPARLSLI